MKFFLPMVCLVITLVLIPDGDAWGGRRRRRRWSFKKIVKKVAKSVKKVVKVYHKYKKYIPIAKTVVGVLSGDAERQLDELAELKVRDRDSYDEYLQRIQADFEERYPKEDAMNMVETLDELADMQPDERLLFVQSLDVADSDYEGELLSDNVPLP